MGVGAGEGEGPVSLLSPVRVERNQRRRKENVLMLRRWSSEYDSPVVCVCGSVCVWGGGGEIYRHKHEGEYIAL